MLYRCTLTNGWDEELIRAKTPLRAAMIYRDVLRERNSTMLPVYPTALVHELMEPESDSGEGHVYEPNREPDRYDLSGSHIRRAA